MKFLLVIIFLARWGQQKQAKNSPLSLVFQVRDFFSTETLFEAEDYFSPESLLMKSTVLQRFMSCFIEGAGPRGH